MKSSMETNSGSGSFTAVTRRRAVASLSPAKQRFSLTSTSAFVHGHQRPPMRSNNSSSSSSTLGTRSAKTKSSNLATDCRPPTKPPPLPRSSVAVSQEETCMVSAAGDVLVCRNREFVQLMGNVADVEGNRSSAHCGDANASARWCDLECSEFPMTLEKSALCNPCLTGTSAHRQTDEKKEDDTAQRSATPGYGVGTGLRGGSTYEWGTEAAGPLEQTAKAFGQLEMELINSTSNITSSPASPRHSSPTEGDGDDRMLSMPSFDYSHFGNGGNDMLPVSPMRNRSQSRRATDSAEIELNPLTKRNNNRNNSTRRHARSAETSPPSLQHHHPTPRRNSMLLRHGVPTFLSSLSQIRIRQVSAHPRGSHVLLISAEQLLFSYGLNDHGQLGIGIKSSPTGSGSDSHKKYVWTPTIITPLLENGGKAITCAAGESHSLVVVSTEGRRILKSRSPYKTATIHNHNNARRFVGGGPPFEMNRVTSSPPTMDMEKDLHGDKSEQSIASASTVESVFHHQLYGFGRNNFMKIGLVHPRRKNAAEQSKITPLAEQASDPEDAVQDDLEDVLLPHRVALHCTVWPETSSHVEGDEASNGAIASPLPPRGIFALAASSEHSAALVRRATGDIELYTWGNAAYHALGISSTDPAKLQSSKIGPVPTLVERLSYTAKHEDRKNSSRLFKQNPPEFPVDVSLGPYSSFVVTSLGRCLSFGISYDGMLGLGHNVTEAKEPKAIKFPSGNSTNSQVSITSVSAGTGHVMALSKCGTVYTWGKNTDGRLGLGNNQASKNAEVVASESDTRIEWTPQKLPPLSKTVTQSAIALPITPPLTPSSANNANALPLTPPRDDFGPIVQICAGLDCSVFVTSSGKVLSCGRNSGRLGLGEFPTDVNTPTPLFGGLSLWYRPMPPPRPPSRRASPSPAKNRPVLKRGLSTPG